MEEEDKDGTLKAGEKPSVIHTPTPKPRPVPRPRNLAKGATTVQNGKPGKISPKPVILPKPRRPPPNAPFAKPVSPDDEEKNVTNNNEVAIDKKPLGKPLTETGTCNTSLSFTNLTSSKESINNVETSCSENGPANVNSIDDDDEWYEPLRRNTETVSSNSEDDYEHVTTRDKSQAMVPRSVNKTFKIRMKSELITF